MRKIMNSEGLGHCPLCGGLKAIVINSVNTPFSVFDLVRCEVCQLTRTFPLPTDESLLEHNIANYYGKDANKFIPALQKIRNGIMKLRVKYYLSRIPNTIEKAMILDVGCGEGRLLNAFLDYGCECWGIEHPYFPIKRFLNRENIFYFQGDLLSLDLPEGAFDMIFMWHVLEHLDDPVSVEYSDAFRPPIPI